MATSHKAAAEFYITDHRGTVPALGDRAVLILDGRERAETHHDLARDWARQHHFTHYRLFSGTVYEPHYTSPLIEARQPSG